MSVVNIAEEQQQHQQHHQQEQCDQHKLQQQLMP